MITVFCCIRQGISEGDAVLETCGGVGLHDPEAFSYVYEYR